MKKKFLEFFQVQNLLGLKCLWTTQWHDTVNKPYNILLYYAVSGAHRSDELIFICAARHHLINRFNLSESIAINTRHILIKFIEITKNEIISKHDK